FFFFFFSGAQEVYASSWFAFESMKFLWDKNQPKPTLSTIQTATSEAAEEPTQVPVEGEERNTGLATSQERNPSGFLSCGKKGTPSRPHPKARSRRHRASNLRSHDERVRSLIQNDILNVFVRADRGCYNTDHPFPGNVVGGPHTTHSVGFQPKFWQSHSYSDSSQSHDSGTITPAALQPSPFPSTCSVADEFNIEELR
ncbi:uncharacterized protein LOC135103189, partial [Scylla paramamosain]|uniref:uncharacterized protein LOC135103189 n=1 Tax=Scylla paramamosain TaxID=85552 RepID=UPI0030829734